MAMSCVSSLCLGCFLFGTFLVGGVVVYVVAVLVCVDVVCLCLWVSGGGREGGRRGMGLGRRGQVKGHKRGG